MPSSASQALILAQKSYRQNVIVQNLDVVTGRLPCCGLPTEIIYTEVLLATATWHSRLWPHMCLCSSPTLLRTEYTENTATLK